ncbi:MAG TPA: calcineurin-like phosphoesterase family protein, partial [Pirellulaceae bacterium]
MILTMFAAPGFLAAVEPSSGDVAIARGVVFLDTNGNQTLDSGEERLPGVRVSNGQEIVATDADGSYRLPVDDDTILFVIKPRGLRTPISKDQLPRFFYIHKPHGSPPSRYPGVEPTGPLPPSIDFPLYRQNEPDQFRAILFGDTQPRDQVEIDYIAHDVVEGLMGTSASFGVTLGDVAFDDLSMFEPQAQMIALLGIPWYNVLGNHDLNFDARDDAHSDETFERVFGPNYYAFDYGPIHFLVLDDVRWRIDPSTGEGGYVGGLDAHQLEFVRRDLAMIPDEQMVVLLMHIPLIDVEDRHGLYRLIEKRPFCLSISAHNHMHEHRFITREDGWQGPEPHHHVINVTVCGSWWSGAQDERRIPHTTMADGAPNGYSILAFDGHHYELTFRAAGRSARDQMSIYLPESIPASKLDATDVVVNVYNGSERSTVNVRVRGQTEWQTLQRVAEVDPYYRAVFEAESKILQVLQPPNGPENEPWRKLTAPKLSSHLWK